ncbi:MAG: hypothetical protein HYT29_01640 [Parcubacteria group bacterium]|nr:hypothetical protein [Parcubacteria group bacterium]
MKVVFTEPLLRCLKKLPQETKKKFEKQIKFLLKDIRHPSLRAKKYDEERDMWQARVDDFYRFYFTIETSAYIILAVTKHPK